MRATRLRLLDMLYPFYCNRRWHQCTRWMMFCSHVYRATKLANIRVISNVLLHVPPVDVFPSYLIRVFHFRVICWRTLTSLAHNFVPSSTLSLQKSPLLRYALRYHILLQSAEGDDYFLALRRLLGDTACLSLVLLSLTLSTFHEQWTLNTVHIVAWNCGRSLFRGRGDWQSSHRLG